MIGDVGVHGVDDRHVVDVFGGGSGEQFADGDSALAVLFELEGGLHDRAGLALGAEVAGGDRLAVILREQRFVVEGIDLRRAAVHEEMDDLLGARLEVWLFGGEREGGEGELRSGVGDASQDRPQHRRGRRRAGSEHAETGAAACEQVATGTAGPRSSAWDAAAEPERPEVVIDSSSLGAALLAIKESTHWNAPPRNHDDADASAGVCVTSRIDEDEFVCHRAAGRGCIGARCCSGLGSGETARQSPRRYS